MCELLKKLAAININVPITIILDNAKYQKCDIVTELASLLKINLIYLPSYSPNLNLIERLWMFIKNKGLNGRYYCIITLIKSKLNIGLSLKFISEIIINFILNICIISY